MMATPRKRKRHPIDVPKLRRTLLWSVPVFLGGIYLSWSSIGPNIIAPYRAIQSRAPVVEILGMSLIGPLGGLFLLSALLLSLARAFYLDTIGDWIEDKLLIPTSIPLGGMIPLIAVLSYPIQSYYMPRLGYTRCDILYGHTSLVSPSRWLKYPELCVRDKGVKWVKEESEKIERARLLPKPLPEESR